MNKKILELLKKRGYEKKEDIEEYLSFSPQKIYDPFLFEDMKEGVDLILSTVRNNDKICIYGDYDADGVTSVSLLMDVIGNLTDNLEYYIPSRFDEGYGLNKEAIKKIAESKAKLIITVDCGVVSVEEIEYGKSLGLDFLVTDHHRPGKELPNCLIINPAVPKCNYPFKSLAGVGVAFKLAQAIVKEANLEKKLLLKNLDLVAIGTIGDVVPLIDENRTLTKYGLKVLRLNQRKGLEKLFENLNLKAEDIVSEDISFKIVPIINASGRMHKAYGAAKLLQSKENEEVENLASELIKYNIDRKDVQREIFDKANTFVRANDLEKEELLLIEIIEGHEGISGIVAGRIKEKYNKPAVIVTKTDEAVYKGTGRTYGNLNLHSLLSESRDLFENFGGHKAACGFTIKSENLRILREEVKNNLKKYLKLEPDLLIDEMAADIIIEEDDDLFEIEKEQNLLEPFGMANRKPIFEVSIRPFDIKRIGRNEEYIKFSGIVGENIVDFLCFKNVEKLEKKLDQININKNNINQFKAIDKIKNNIEELKEDMNKGERIDVMGSLGLNSFRGNERLQIIVEI